MMTYISNYIILDDKIEFKSAKYIILLKLRNILNAIQNSLQTLHEKQY